MDVDICARNRPQKAGLANVWVAADEECSGIGVYRWQTAEMLSYLLEICQWVAKTLADCGHTTKGGALETFALEEGLSVFDEAHIVARDALDKVLRCADLSEGDFEVVAVI